MFAKQKRKGTVILACILAAGSFVTQPVSSEAATKKPTQIELSAKSKTLEEGASVTLKVKSVKPTSASKAVTWSTSNKGIATVSEKGKVTAKKAGKANITATSKSNKKATAVCKVTVTKKKTTVPSCLTLNMKSKTLEEGASVTLKVKSVKPASASKAVTWSTSNKGIATVSSKGKVTAKKAGKVNITATSKSNKKVTAVCKITVKKKAEENVLYSGSYENTSWKIYKDGLLEVKGTGEMYDGEGYDEYPQWCDKYDFIKSAKIEVTGATDLSSLFYNCSNLESVDLSGLDTSKAIFMSYMFSGCSSLTSLDVSKFDTSNVTNMSKMFSGCSSLKSLDVSSFDISNVTYMSSMFYNCSSLTSLDVSKFNTSKVESMSSMFENCSSLTSLDVSKFNTSNVEDMSYMFEDCSSLTSIDVSNFDMSNVYDYEDMFYGCDGLSIVPTPWIPKPAADGSIFSGSYGDTSWKIYEDGLLEIKGTGNVYDSDEDDGPAWCARSKTSFIKSAKVELTGATSLSSLFEGCDNLTSVDLSGLKCYTNVVTVVANKI